MKLYSLFCQPRTHRTLRGPSRNSGCVTRNGPSNVVLLFFTADCEYNLLFYVWNGTVTNSYKLTWIRTPNIAARRELSDCLGVLWLLHLIYSILFRNNENIIRRLTFGFFYYVLYNIERGMQCIRQRGKETWPELLSQHMPVGPKAIYENRSLFS